MIFEYDEELRMNVLLLEGDGGLVWRTKDGSSLNGLDLTNHNLIVEVYMYMDTDPAEFFKDMTVIEANDGCLHFAEFNDGENLSAGFSSGECDGMYVQNCFPRGRWIHLVGYVEKIISVLCLDGYQSRFGDSDGNTLKSDTNQGDNSICIGDSMSGNGAFYGKIAYINIYTEQLNLYQTYAMYERAKNNMAWFEGFDVKASSTVNTFVNEAKEEGYSVKVSKDGVEKSGQDIMSTGLNIDLYINNAIVFSQDVVIPGDTTGDGKISSSDYMKAKRAFSNPDILTGAYFKAADIDGNNKITSLDYMKIKRCFKGGYSI